MTKKDFGLLIKVKRNWEQTKPGKLGTAQMLQFDQCGKLWKFDLFHRNIYVIYF